MELVKVVSQILESFSLAFYELILGPLSNEIGAITNTKTQLPK